MSVSHIVFNENQKAIQITTRLFIDDLQLELNSLKNTNIEIATDREPQNIDSIYINYLKDNFLINVNSIDKQFQYIGKEYGDVMVVFYLEIKNITSINTILVKNNLLCKSFSDQENILKLDINNKNKSIILTKNNSQALVNY